MPATPPFAAPPAGLLGLSFVTWFGVCMAVAAVYAVVYPKPVQGQPAREPFRAWVLRWGHSVVWVLMAAGCLLANDGRMLLAKTSAWCALGIYILFMTLLVSEKMALRKTNRPQ